MESQIPSVRKLTLWEIDPPIPKKSRHLFGFDPGTTHLGIAWTTRNGIIVAQIELEREKNPIKRMICVHTILNHLLPSMQLTRQCATSVVEGSSFGDNFRQVELAEVRSSLAWWLMFNEIGTVYIIPPLSIRKAVFGSAKLKAQDVWDNTDIPNDALAALSCLYYADKMEDHG